MELLKKYVWQNTYVIPLILFLLAALFRLTFLELIEFKADEALAIFTAAKFYQNPYIITNSGISSIGVFYPPLSYFLVTILAIFSRNPIVVTGLIAFLNCLAVVGFYLLLKKYYSQMIAIFYSITMALSPWSILFSRKIWNPDMILFLLLPFLYFLHRFLFDENKKALFWLSLFLTLLCQLHFSAIYLGIITIVIIWLYKKKILDITVSQSRMTEKNYQDFTISYSQIFSGIVLGLIPALPWFFTNLSSQPFCRDCVAFSKYLKIAKNFDFNHILRPWQFLNGLNFEMVLGKDFSQFLSNFPLIQTVQWLFWLELLVPVIGLYLIIKEKRQWMWLIFYSVLVPVIYFLTKIPAYPYYFVILSPMVFVISAISWTYLHSLFKPKFWQYVVYGLFIVFQVTHIIFMLSFFGFIQGKQEINGDYGPVFAKTNTYIDNQVKQYKDLPYYDELRAFAFVYKNPQHLHQQLGRYFAQKGHIDLAITELKQALGKNHQDSFSRSMISQLYIIIGDYKEASTQINLLKNTNSTIASQLETILQRRQLEQQLLKSP